ncbi:OSBP family protein [Sporobolomyces salmoneus]|uniref:OSBP family protein n=1 Tax=Sporobolomyces salmoneus TaxID=183962 RepID=UPI00317FC7A0
MTKEEVDAVPPAQKSGWSSFLKSIASASGDLSSLTAPSFILSPTSLSEFPSYWGEPTELFCAIADGTSPEDRQLRVTKWFISTLSGQFTRREKETGSEKKPLNPFLGEQFNGQWNNGELVLHTEQVSHHPPVTAYYLENPKRGVSLEGNCAQKTTFSARTLSIRQVGHAILRVKLADAYLITLPKLKIEGLWYGSPYVELDGSSYIQSSHGFLTTIKYSGKGWVSGKSHSFTAEISPAPSASPIHTITGVWSGGESVYSKPSKFEGQVFLNADDNALRTPIQVAPVEQQQEYESRRAWKAVADGIRKGDFEAASSAKSALENSERQKRKDEAAAGTAFQLRLFNKLPNDPEYKQLAAMCKHKPEDEESYIFKSRQ